MTWLRTLIRSSLLLYSQVFGSENCNVTFTLRLTLHHLILGVHGPTTTTSSKGLTSSKAPTILSQSSTSSTLASKRTTPFGKTKAQTSVDWLDEKNLPILIGVSVTIFILLIIVIVFISMTCARRLVAGVYWRRFQFKSFVISGVYSSMQRFLYHFAVLKVFCRQIVNLPVNAIVSATHPLFSAVCFCGFTQATKK